MLALSGTFLPGFVYADQKARDCHELHKNIEGLEATAGSLYALMRFYGTGEFTVSDRYYGLVAESILEVNKELLVLYDQVDYCVTSIPLITEELDTRLMTAPVAELPIGIFVLPEEQQDTVFQ